VTTTSIAAFMPYGTGGNVKDGTYDLVFSANGHDTRASLQFDGRRARASEGEIHLEGNFVNAERHLTAVFDVLMAPCLLRNARIPERYSVQMSGTGSERDFNLIGIGPLGLIVEIAGSYRCPLAEAAIAESGVANLRH
jgi:hypothetical protein